MAARRAGSRAVALSGRESAPALLLVAVLTYLPGWSLHLAGWSDHLEPVGWAGVAGAIAGWALARSPWRALAVHLLGLVGGAAALTLLYATFLSAPNLREQVEALLGRVSHWLTAAVSGGASTDTLLFAFSMALLAWALGHLGAWGVFRVLTPWWAIVPTGAGLLLNLSYSSPDLLPLAYAHLVGSFLLLTQVNTLRRLASWRIGQLAEHLHQGAGFALGGGVLGVGMVMAAWAMPVGEVSRAAATVWETVSGPWQDAQATFDRLFAALNPSPLSARGLTAMQSLAPRGSFELGDQPIYRVSGRQPAYWRAATYDRYTGQLMTASPSTSVRRDRRQPLIDSMETGEGRRFTEYSFLVLAPATSVLHAPDLPLTVSLPAVYDYRNDLSDFALLRPAAPLRQGQQYSVLASVPTASISELRRAGTIYPPWTRSYLQLPEGFPDAVRQEAWRVVGDATNVYDAAARIEAYLRTFPYKTRVAVPPPGWDWAAFVLFESKEGYCDYFATTMAVMLRSIGIPARVATGYVTGEWDPATQSYLVLENHAHTWTEVYFPGFGWVTFEPSANRPLPPRTENPLIAETEEEQQQLLESETTASDFLEDEELFDESDFVPLPEAAAPAPPIGLILVGILSLGALGVLILGPALWIRQMRRLPAFARPYAQVVRLATWFGLGPRASQTPYEYTGELARALPEAADALETVGTVYVEGLYGGRTPDASGLQRLRAAGRQAGRWMVQSLGLERWRALVNRGLRQLVGDRR